MTIQFFVDGIPKAQPRPRSFARKGKVRVYDPSTAEGWKSLIALAAQPHIPEHPLTGPLIVSETFYFPRPKRLCRKQDSVEPIPHESTPDRDNLDKAVLDALTTIRMWHNDSQIYDGFVRKFYAARGGRFARPGVNIRIEATP